MVPRVGHSWIFIQFEFVEHKPSDDSPVPVCLANCSDKPRLNPTAGSFWQYFYQAELPRACGKS